MTNQSISTSAFAARVDDLMALSRVVNKFIEVKRATMRGDRHETDGEHTLHLQYISVAYAAKYHPDLDIGKVCLYGLVHDFVEVYAGDVNSLNATPAMLARKEASEKAAFATLEVELGDRWPQFVGYIEEYESLATKEARFVKCFDKCDPSFTHYENAGSALRKMGVVDRDEFHVLCAAVKERMSNYAHEFPDVLAVRKELLQRVADATYTPV